MERAAETRRILILGATSRIAEEIAKIWATRNAELYLVGRSRDKLDSLRSQLTSAKRVWIHQADFTDFASSPTVVEQAVAALGQVDEVYIAHGDLGDQLLSERDYSEAERIFQVNCLSVLALLIPLAERMERQGRGHIAVITSVAADRGRPRNFTYGAAKAALNVYLEGLRSRLYPSGVTVTTIRLGPVDTPMTREHAKNLLFSTPAIVAQRIVWGQRNGDVYVPGIWRWIMLIVRSLPLTIFQRLPFLSGR
jgi:decaprenylphospho-beta-D-erythro-pentofuranosid-2-ulose 2-reductase